jgi:hypothetical protein
MTFPIISEVLDDILFGIICVLMTSLFLQNINNSFQVK